jgi:hypothetical protein
MPKLDPALQRIVDLGDKLFGDNWQSAFARMCGLSASCLNRITNSDRPVTDATHAAVRAGLKAESKRLRERA